MPSNITISVLSGGLGGGIAGTIAGALVSHFLAKRRDAAAREHAFEDARQERIRQFRAFLTEWLAEIHRQGHPPRIVALYEVKDAVFVREADKVRRDFVEAARFAKLCDAVRHTGHTIGEVNPLNHELVGKARFLPALDSLVTFVDAQ